MTLSIGRHSLSAPVLAAPMAGVSDKPWRRICRQYGAGLAVSEMVTSQLHLRHATKSRFRMDLQGEQEPVAVQLVGTDAEHLAAAARFNVANGAQIIDINMGCPAKKVCKKAAGSALLENPPLVAAILQAVVASVSVPVTVKIRTGPNPQNRNAVSIAKIAEDAGVQAITIHGRTRQCRFVGAVEYDTIAAVKHSVSVPVIANGDIDSPQKAAMVVQATGADGVMIGRAAQGQPWLFQRIVNHLKTGVSGVIPDLNTRATTVLQHVNAIHQFYGAGLGVRLARKHIKWYLQHWPVGMTPELRLQISTTEDIGEQFDQLAHFLHNSQILAAA